MRDSNGGCLGNPADGWQEKAQVVSLEVSGNITTRRLDVVGVRRMTKIIRLPGASEKIIIFGQNVYFSGTVVDFNIKTGVNTDLLPAGKYVINDAFEESDGIRFTGERQKDSAIVTVNITDLKTDSGPDEAVGGVQKAKQLVPIRR